MAATGSQYILESESEKSRLAAQHDAIKILCDSKLILVPLDFSGPQLKILDSGTADGHWLQDVVNELPQAPQHILIGTDITDRGFPSEGDRGPRQYLVQDVRSPWPETWRDSFDLVHQRLVLGACGSFPVEDAIKALCELVKPGGYIQLIEPEQICGVNDGPAMRDFIQLVTEVFAGLGGGVRYAGRLGSSLQLAGMEDITEMGIPLYLGGPSIQDAALRRRIAISSAYAMEPLVHFAKSLPNPVTMSQERMTSLKDRLLRELSESGGYYPLRIVTAKKPKP